MSKKSVFCIASTHEQSELIVDQLKVAHFYRNDISVLYPDKESTHNFAHEKNTKAPEGIVIGVSIGAILGGVMGCSPQLERSLFQRQKPFPMPVRSCQHSAVEQSAPSSVEPSDY